MDNPHLYLHGNNATGHENPNRSCITFKADTAQTVFDIKVSLSVFAIVVNLFVIILILFMKKANKFMYRLVLYLLTTDILQAIAIIMISLPITVPGDEGPASTWPGQGWFNDCIASGFISVVTLWMGNIIIFWIALYLAWIGLCLYRRTQNYDVINSFPHPRVSEGLGIFFLLMVVPIVIAIIPLFAHGNMYGVSGLWCWIKVMINHCGDLHKIPLIVDLILFYAPLIFIVLFTTIFSVVTVTCCCRGAVRRHDAIVALRKSDMKDIIIVLVIPLVYCGLCLLLLINRLHSAAHESPTSYPYIPLWMTHAVADPVRVILPALAYLFNPYVWKDIHRVCTRCRAKDSSQLLLNERSNKGYGSCNDTENMYEDDDVTDDEYVQSLLKVNTKI